MEEGGKKKKAGKAFFYFLRRAKFFGVSSKSRGKENFPPFFAHSSRKYQIP